MGAFDLHTLEEKYRDRWPAEFEADHSGKDKFYINVAFPYPSGAMHVGHGRTYTVPDIVARFWRMRGRQVLFPMGFHVTGTPVIGISKRIAKQDAKTIWLYRDLYGVPQEVLDTFTDPMVIVRYFAGEYERMSDPASGQTVAVPRALPATTASPEGPASRSCRSRGARRPTPRASSGET